ncbi:hypothetical protein [Sneathiella sp.]|uniref:hypothetical protein n=1 Tax=Sneathiella sp. TaxID=1964365 RepID=UPI00356A3002
MNGKITKVIAIIASLFLSACADPVPVSPIAAQPQNEIIAKSYTVNFYDDVKTGQLVSGTGQPFPRFLQDLARVPSASLQLRQMSPELDMKALLETVQVSKINHVLDVAIVPDGGSGTSAAVLRANVTYYLFRFVDCADNLDQRKLDRVELTSPGFGCAVERNLMLSLARPGDWHQGRRSTPPLAITDAAAVRRFYEAAPRPFSSRDQK